MCKLKALMLGVVVVCVLALSTVGWTAQVSIEFTGLSFGSFTGPSMEDGFTYSLLLGSGGLFVNNNSLGNPTPEMEGEGASGGGILRIVSSTPMALFNFVGADIAEFDTGNPGNNNQITFEGFKGGVSAGTEMFIPPQATPVPPNDGAYQSVLAGGSLFGAPIDELQITLPAGFGTFGELSYARIDNILLDNMPAVPTPSAFLLMGTGLLGLIGYRKWANKNS